MISIIIPNLHSPIIDQVIAALQRQTARNAIEEIIVVGQDNHGLVPHDVTFIRTEKPISAAKARNLGARHARSKILLFIDSDCIGRPSLIETLLQCHNAEARAICGGVAPGYGSYWARCDNLLVFADFLNTAPPGTRAYLPSLNFSLPRSIFLQLGGFDETFPGAAGEDLDFSLRLREAGYPLYFAPQASIEHRHQRASARSIWEHLRLFGRAQVRVARMRPSLQSGRVARLPSNTSALIMACAVPLACLDIINLCITRPAVRRYPSTLPGMVWARTGWYWGVAEGLYVTPKS